MNKEKLLAVALAQHLYRNTEIEKFHSKNIRMDYCFFIDAVDYFNQILSLSRKLSWIVRLVKKELLYGRQETAILMARVKSFEELDFYYGLHICCLNGDNWKEPIEVKLNKKMSPGKYILNGEFKKKCLCESLLNDDTMCVINQDVCNRFYTLLKNGFYD